MTSSQHHQQHCVTDPRHEVSLDPCPTPNGQARYAGVTGSFQSSHFPCFEPVNTLTKWTHTFPHKNYECQAAVWIQRLDKDVHLSEISARKSKLYTIMQMYILNYNTKVATHSNTSTRFKRTKAVCTDWNSNYHKKKNDSGYMNMWHEASCDTILCDTIYHKTIRLITMLC